MSSGSQVVDLRKPQDNNCGTAMVGRYYSKTWSGTNAPASAMTRPRTLRFIRDSRGIIGINPLFFGKPKRTRNLQPNDYTCSWERSQELAFRWYYASNPTLAQGGTATTCGFRGLDPTRPFNANDALALIGQLREKIVGSDFDAGVFLAEGKESLGLIANAAIRIDRAYRKVRQGNIVGAAHALVGKKRRQHRNINPTYQTMSSAWLELQYGWLPLVQDAYEGAQALAHFCNAPCTFRVVARKHKSGVLLPGSIGEWSSGFNYERRQIIALLTEVDVAKLSGLTNPATLVWERLPWSFVLDWFIPIGNYLQARGTATALSGTFITSAKWHWKVSGVRARAGSGYIFNDSYAMFEKGQFTRSVSNTLEVPKPSYKSFGQIASWQHCANAVSLLVSTARNPRD